MWWDDDTIEKTVTRQFVCSYLLPEEIVRLDQQLGFGDGLTDGTYWEWIREKAKRIFLILVDLNVPDQIFGIVDDSWDDEDLPIALDQVERLALTRARDERLERRFYERQFYYMLKPLQKGDCRSYEDYEVVPLDVVEKRPGLAPSSLADRVTVPQVPGTTFCRRRVPLEYGQTTVEQFQAEVDIIKNISNRHLVSYWASYMHQGYGYVLFTPASDLSLKTFLSNTPTVVKNMDKKARRQLVMNWVHCLMDTMCYIHSRGLSHGNIKPSTVLLNNKCDIFLSDFTRFNAGRRSAADKASFDKESYDFAAPEQWYKPTSASAMSALPRRGVASGGAPSESSYTFSMSRGNGDNAHAYAASLHAPIPQLDPQAADVFSLGCVILELLSFLLKKHGQPFARHRAAKHKSAGRGGAVLDSSFHKNLTQVESWMTQLAKDAAKKDDPVFKGFTPMLHVVERMLAANPADRPAAHEVQARMYEVLTEASGITEPHCVHQYGGGWDFGFGARASRLSQQTPAARDTAETMSIATKRLSSSSATSTLAGLLPRRPPSGHASNGSSRRGAFVAGARNTPSPPDRGLGPTQASRDTGDARPGWQSPALAV